MSNVVHELSESLEEEQAVIISELSDRSVSKWIREEMQSIRYLRDHSKSQLDFWLHQHSTSERLRLGHASHGGKPVENLSSIFELPANFNSYISLSMGVNPSDIADRDELDSLISGMTSRPPFVVSATSQTAESGEDPVSRLMTTDEDTALQLYFQRLAFNHWLGLELDDHWMSIHVTSKQSPSQILCSHRYGHFTDDKAIASAQSDVSDSEHSETDWEEDDIKENEIFANLQNQNATLFDLLKLPKERQKAVLKQFIVLYKAAITKEWALVRAHATSNEGTASGTTPGGVQSDGRNGRTTTKRRRTQKENDGPSKNTNRRVDEPVGSESPISASGPQMLLACPFRKRNPGK